MFQLVALLYISSTQDIEPALDDIIDEVDRLVQIYDPDPDPDDDDQ
jgi:hypothetical protein